MKMKKNYKALLGTTIAGAGLLLANPLNAEAHCDTAEGPTYDAMQTSIEEENFDHIAYWVPEEGEEELAKVYELSTNVMEKTEDGDTEELAQRYLFENFVRIHRAGEGAPYTGISEEPVDDGVKAADESIAQESLDPLEEAGFITDGNRGHVEEVFADLLETKDFEVNDTEAGRAYVENYVTFTHLFEEGHGEEYDDHHEGQEEEHGAHIEEVHIESEESDGNWFTRLLNRFFN